MSSTVRPTGSPHPTVRLRADTNPQPNSDLSNTDYELTNSVAFPPNSPPKPIVVQLPGRPAGPLVSTELIHEPELDPATRALFQQRLRLCCLVAAAPFGFFLLSASTNFIELFGRSTIGWTGLVLTALTWIGLLGTAVFLTRTVVVSSGHLRVLEVAVFGTMALYFAYWHFNVLTGVPPDGYEGIRHEQASVIAASVIVHFNWFAIIVLHGVLVPNSLSRGVGVALSLCLGGLVIDVVAAFVHPPARHYVWAVFAIAITMLAAGAGLSIFGTAKTEALRREVESAREAIRQLGHYRLRKKLGQGGMGEVYLAEHYLIKRPCAVKRIHPRFLNNVEQVRRFEREVQTTAQLRHPNTVEIYDYGRAEDGTFYYVMEYLAGLSLEELVNQHGAVPADRAIHIIRQVCSALRAAHQRDLVHRDIKPSNIIIVPDNLPHDMAKLLDFGLVHSLAEDIDPQSKITRDGLIVGTPEYMSPEQASGMTLDGRSDLFSLGSVLYFLLTGREAFHRDNPMKTLLAVVNEEPTPVHSLNPLVPDDVVIILRKCLAKEPSERYESALALDQALASCGVSQVWTEERAKEWWTARPNSLPETGTDLNSLPLQDSMS